MPESEKILQEVFDSISTGIFVVDVDYLDGSQVETIAFRFVTNNPAYIKMLLVPTTVLAGFSPHDCFSPEIADKFCTNFRRCLEQGQSITYEEYFEFESGNCTLLTTLCPKFEADGRISKIIGSSQDITERKQLENSLSKDKELLSTLIKNAPIGIISTDELGKILFVNPTYEKICGYSYEELVGKFPPYPYWDLADLEKIYEEFTKAIIGESKDVELWFTRKNGERFLARLQPITILDEQGNMLRHLATMEDITKYKQAEEELQKALETEIELNELKTRFIAMVSHEYRTPLTTILSSTELLENYSCRFTKEQKLKHYHRIKNSVFALTGLVNDVLTISKIETGNEVFSPALLDLEKLCRELVEELQSSMGSQHNLVFKLQVYGTSAPQTTAYMDAKLLRYIINNLLSNAIKYSPQGSTVRFDLVWDKSQVILCIQDEGIGIPTEARQRLFEPFHRATNVGNISGTGLGLAIVKKAVDLQGGKITVESEVGVGTKFTVTLPSDATSLTAENAP